jgi:hypothetical protein
VNKLLVPILVIFLASCTTLSPLTKAAKDCNLPALRQQVAGGGNVNETAADRDKSTALHLAAYQCADGEALPLIRTLVENGAAVDARDGYGRSALIIAAGGKPRSAFYLIEKGADVNARDSGGETPLLAATAAGSSELASALVNRKADVNAANADGITPLINAALFGDVRLATLLLAAGADPSFTDNSGRTAAEYAISYKKMEMAVLLKEAEAQHEAKAAPARRDAAMRIRTIVGRVKACLMPEARTYTVAISRERQPNASVNLSGEIIFTQGALRLWDDDTLTFVAAHEIAHDKLGHVGKKIAVSAVTSGIMMVADFFIPGVGLLNHAVNPAVVNNYSKSQELEADKLASEACNRCFGITTERQIQLMMNIRKTSKEGGGFWATHPAWSDRIKSIKE